MGGQNVKENNISNLINLIWLDPNVYNSENKIYQGSLKELNKFHIYSDKRLLISIKNYLFSKNIYYYEWFNISRIFY